MLLENRIISDFVYLPFIGLLVWFKAWPSYPTPSYTVNIGAFANCVMLDVWVLRVYDMKFFGLIK